MSSPPLSIFFGPKTEFSIITYNMILEFKPLFTSKLFIIILENNLKTTLECTTYVLSFPLSYYMIDFASQ